MFCPKIQSLMIIREGKHFISFSIARNEECKKYTLIMLWGIIHEKYLNPAEKQYRLIMEYCKSDLTDHEYCVGHDIKPSTFYNRVKKIHKKAALISTDRSYKAPVSA